MKKLIVLFSAVAALAACSKNEVVPAVSGENVEISYKVTLGQRLILRLSTLKMCSLLGLIICLQERTGVTTRQRRRYTLEKTEMKELPSHMSITFGKTRQLLTIGQRKVNSHSSRIH